MRKLFAMLTAVAPLSLAGCQFFQQPKPQAMTETVLDVRPVRAAAPRFSPPVLTATPPEEPGVAIAVESQTTVTPSIGAVRGMNKKVAAAPRVQQASDKTSYKVKKGDTLYRIAKTEYGDGKKWTVIASANPGLSPQSLKSGQTIVIP